MVESNPERTSILLADVFSRRGIKYGIFDVDGTLLDTHNYYFEYMWDYAESIANLGRSKFDENEVFDSMDRILNGLRSTYSVDPALMQETARITALRYGQDYYGESVQKSASKLMGLYSGVPEAFEGVYETLRVLDESGLALAVATHTGEPWTKVKLAKNGMLNFFEKRIFTFDTLGVKGVREWRSVLVALGVQPEEVLVVGDSIGSDIVPSLELNIPPEQVFRITTDYLDANKGELNKNVRELFKFADLPYAILEKLN